MAGLLLLNWKLPAVVGVDEALIGVTNKGSLFSVPNSPPWMRLLVTVFVPAVVLTTCGAVLPLLLLPQMMLLRMVKLIVPPEAKIPPDWVLMVVAT